MNLLTLGLITFAAINDPQLIADAASDWSIPAHDRAYCCALIYEYGLRDGVRYETRGITRAIYGSRASDWLRDSIGSKDEVVRYRQRQIVAFVEPMLFDGELAAIRTELAREPS